MTCKLAVPLAGPGSDPEFWQRLRRHAATGSPVALVGLDTLNPAEAARLLNLFLHEAAVTSPIEPLASLLAALLQKRELSLWELQAGETGAEGSKAAFLRALPQEQPACLACACFPLCQGYGAWAGGCETWRVLIMGLASAARALARLGNRTA